MRWLVGHFIFCRTYKEQANTGLSCNLEGLGLHTLATKPRSRGSKEDPMVHEHRYIIDCIIAFR